MEKSIEYFQKGVINLQDRCVCCGEYVPEGRQVCPNCEKGSSIKDSGNRTKFPTGAVRDMHRGKRKI